MAAYTACSGVMSILGHLAGLDFNCVVTSDGPPEGVRQAVRKVFHAFCGCGLLIATCSSVHSMMPWENTLAVIDEWRTLRSLR